MNAESIIAQIRALQAEHKEFWLELPSGRLVQIYRPHSVATTDSLVGILQESDGFYVVSANQIVSVEPGVHASETARLEARKAELEKRFRKRGRHRKG